MTAAASNQATARLRWGVYWILIALAVGNMTGRILAVNSVDRISLEKYLQRSGRKQWRQQRPFLSANDRSRWDTVRALVEQGTYAIDEIIAEPNWDTIDMVKHADSDGFERLYSSKPPLLATLLAGPYWVIHRVTGWTLGDHPYEMGRFLLLIVNVVPMIVMFVLLAHLVERFGQSDWGRIYVMAAATWATFLNTFAVVLNNHLIAAACAAVAIYAAVRIWCDGARQYRLFATAGFFAALTAATELPALALLALLTVAVLWKAPRPTVRAYLPAAGVVVAAFFITNYAAHGCLTPPYMHRSTTDPADNWYDYSYVKGGRERDSYWRDPNGIDRGEPSAARYALHTLIGHHGIFSLTPVWLVSLAGLAVWGFGRNPRRPAAGEPIGVGPATEPPSNDGAVDADGRETGGTETRRTGADVPGARDGCETCGSEATSSSCGRSLALLIAAVSLACLVFYLSRPLAHRNYGGMTSGFRWMFWLAPLWIVAMVPAADRMANSRVWRAIALVLLAFSVLSASYPTWNPWTYPWLTNLGIYLGWVGF
jgi:hypothetical protein